MPWLLVKYLLTAAVVVLVSEAARRSDRLGGLIAALPLVTCLTLVWMQLERQPAQKIANHAWYTFWYVLPTLPTLPMFVVFPWLLPRLGFWWTLPACAALTMLCFIALAAAMRPFGIQLWG